MDRVSASSGSSSRASTARDRCAWARLKRRAACRARAGRGGIDYQLIGSRGYFRRSEVRAALAHLRLIVNPRNEEAFVVALGIGQGSATPPSRGSSPTLSGTT